MKKIMIIFVVDNTFDNRVFKDYFDKFSASIQWGDSHLHHQNVINITNDDIDFLGKSCIIDIISDANNSFPIGDGEDDWITENYIKIQVLENIKKRNIRHIELIDRLIILLKYARWIHFAF